MKTKKKSKDLLFISKTTMMITKREKIYILIIAYIRIIPWYKIL